MFIQLLLIEGFAAGSRGKLEPPAPRASSSRD